MLRKTLAHIWFRSMSRPRSCARALCDGLAKRAIETLSELALEKATVRRDGQTLSFLSRNW